MDKETKAIMRSAFKEPYPRNLFLTLESDRYYKTEIPVDNITEDMISGLEYAISTLPPRDQRILLMRYQSKMTFAAIGKEFDITGSRIRCLETRALCRLRRPPLLAYIKYGREEYENRQARAKEERDRNYSADKYQIRIIEMDIGIRAQNRLIAKGYEKVKDIIDLTDDEINNIRALGGKSRVEVALALKKLDISGTAWNQYLPKGE